jgi:hypothetical protein
MKISKLCLLSLCASVLPLAVNAQQQDQESQPAPAAEQAPAAAGDSTPAAAHIDGLNTFGSLDIDADGRLSMTESEKSASVKDQFGSLDTDKDSFLSAEEFGKLSPVNPH